MTQINLVDLDFTNIRNSLLTYLKKQDTVKDLNFEGSAVNFLLDLLAYNTLYYAHYANMIASESFLSTAQLEKSLISLVKPLGYVIPSKSSAIATIKLDNVLAAGPLLPYTISVSGFTPEGIKYQFWNIDSIDVVNNATSSFSVYQGNYVSLSYGGNGFDFPDQKIFVPDLSMDIKTLRVSVKPGSGPAPFEVWDRYDLYGGSFLSNDKFYTLEKQNNGYTIRFGVGVGSKLIAGNRVKIEYLSSSGALANNCSNFTSTQTPSGSSISVILPAVGGLNEPNLDEVRQNAPLVFTAQQRLVTIDDYKSFFTQLGATSVKVWGGENNSPPTYGRVFYSFYVNADDINTLYLLGEAQVGITQRNIITVIPEYVQPITTKVGYSLSINHDPSVSAYSDAVYSRIKTNIQNYYPTNTFDVVFEKRIVKQIIEQEPGYSLNENEWFIDLNRSFIPQNFEVVINFKTSLVKNNIGSGLQSTSFTSPEYGSNCFLQDIPINYEGATNPPKIGNIGLYKFDSSGVPTYLNFIVGKIDYETGIVTINKKISNNVVTISGKPIDQNKFTALDELFIQPEIKLEKVTTL